MSDDRGVRPMHGEAGDPGLIGSMGMVMRHWRLILGAAATAGVLTLVVVEASVAQRWESTATLVIAPPRFSSELKPAALSVQGYQKLLESGSVIAEARRRLVERGALARGQELRMGSELETRIFVSRRSEETSLSPMVLAVAYGRSAKQAAEIANTWAECFLETTNELSMGATSPTVESVDRQYTGVAGELAQLEARQLAAATRGAERYDGAADRWERAISGQTEADIAAVAAYRAETARLLEGYAGEHDLETRRARLGVRRQTLAELEGEHGRVEAQLAGKRLELEAARTQLAQTPQLVSLKKAMSDDAMLQAAARDGDKAGAGTAGARTLVSQEVNPVHTELAGTVARLEIEVSALAPRAAQLAALGVTMAAGLHEDEVALAADDAGAAALKEQREAGLLALMARQSSAATVLARARNRELAGLKGEQEMEKSAISRDVATHQELFAALSKVHNQAMLVKMQPSSGDVRLAAPAVAPHSPEPKGTAVKTALAAALGGLLGLLAAVALETRPRVAHPVSPTGS